MSRPALDVSAAAPAPHTAFGSTLVDGVAAQDALVALFDSVDGEERLDASVD